MRIHQILCFAAILSLLGGGIGCGAPPADGTSKPPTAQSPGNEEANPPDDLTDSPDDVTDSNATSDASPASDDRDPADADDAAETPGPIVETNRLVNESSPYLRQHGHNPVDWYPWGEEALEKAKQEDKLIFLSVGYSSCHWCHVMERESFLDPEIAGYLNQNFVCVKVDREERPDIDTIYMTALHVYNRVSGSGGGGGWPMSMFLLPDTRPFFGGTYFPARDGDRGARMGFLTLIQRIQEIWGTQAADIRSDAQTLTEFVRAELDGRRPAPLADLESELLSRAVGDLLERFDPAYGGFSFHPSNPNIPKFPEPPNLLFLMDRIRSEQASDETKALAQRMLETTLEKMAMGGIRDHLGGGFHRYSVDRYWKIPHFEKMLYDNGQLASVYSEAYALWGKESHRRIVSEILEFVAREMTSPEGGFYAALDAESEHVEGKFYRWELEEVKEALTAEEYALVADVYQLDEPPNFEGEYYAPELEAPLAELAKARDLTEAELDARLGPLRAKLLAVRNERPRPLTDTKVLTSWNGLMIRGYADAGRIFEKVDYVATATKAARLVLDKLRTDDGRLLRTYSAGEAKLNAYLDDYAFLIDGLIAIHRATDDEQWLAEADALMQKQIELFWDAEQGGFFFTTSDHESLIARGRDPFDGVEPSGNNVSATNLLYLSQHLKNDTYHEKAGETIRSVAGILQASPSAAPRMATALAIWLEK